MFVCKNKLEQRKYVYIQNHPNVSIQSAVHHEVFTAGALEARVCRKSTVRAPSGKTD